MKVIIQRVERASVSVEDKTIGEIGKGFLILLGVGQNDSQVVADAMIDKIRRLRIFQDADGKTNLSIEDVDGDVLIISQFTLYADCRKGNRPSFTGAGSPEQAEAVYDYFVSKCRPVFNKTESGVFGAYMKVSLVNDGPFTVALEME